MTRHRSPRVLAVAAATALLAPPLLNAQASPSHARVRQHHAGVEHVRGAARPRRPRAGARDQRAAAVLGRQALVGRLGDLVRRGSGASDPAGIPALISAAIRTALFALLFMGSVLVYIPYLLAAGGATGGWHFGAWRYLGLLPLGA